MEVGGIAKKLTCLTSTIVEAATGAGDLSATANKREGLELFVVRATKAVDKGESFELSINISSKPPLRGQPISTFFAV